MATLETQQLDEIIVNTRRKMLTMGGAALAALAFGGTTKAEAQSTTTGDQDILNFALNLEYLEAQYYNLAVSGVTIDQLPTPIPVAVNGGTAGSVTLKPSFAKVPFASSIVAAYAAETAIEEGKHVIFLQKTLGKVAVSMPDIDLFTSFNALAALANIGTAFDPFASDANFLIGAYIFEDVGVSAYHGAAPLITDKTNVLPAAVGIHAVEAYHAGLVRTVISVFDNGVSTGPLSTMTQAISAARSKLANPDPDPKNAITVPFTTFAGTTADDLGVQSAAVGLNSSSTTTTFPSSTIANTDLNALGWSRNSTQILAIVTGNPATATSFQGGFFPSGLNGNIA
ncbi:ferritin-like domain-containing protein [Tunturiibacter gelidiferens]|uniref:ferritin-like domain-containing protein n=1 Tax=Tunturiibacter gelidiferens TaxID=3069689 RepID=UPI003D9B32F9